MPPYSRGRSTSRSTRTYLIAHVNASLLLTLTYAISQFFVVHSIFWLPSSRARQSTSGLHLYLESTSYLLQILCRASPEYLSVRSRPLTRQTLTYAIRQISRSLNSSQLISSSESKHHIEEIRLSLALDLSTSFYIYTFWTLSCFGSQLDPLATVI